MINKIIDAMKSNPHIEIINPNLWAVNFDYVLNGWIDGLKFYDTTDKDFATLIGNKNIGDGIIVLNSNAEIYKKVIPILQYIMKLPNNKIGKQKSFCDWIKTQVICLKKKTDKQIINFVKQNNCIAAMEFYFNLSKLEIDRRRIVKND